MKLFSKKSEADTLHTLDEKEIQKRLYGRYHRETTVPVHHFNSNVNAAYPKLEIKAPSKAVPLSTRFNDFLMRLKGPFSSFFNTFPWKLAGIVSAGLVISIVLFQALSFWLSRLKEVSLDHSRNVTAHASKTRHVANTKPEDTKERLQKAQVPKKSRTTESATLGSIATTFQSPLSLAKPIEVTLKKKYYSVQICTYQREQDAKQLTEELKDSNLSAFYLRIPSSQQQMPHFVVFLGKEETYAGAGARLKDFQKTQHFQKFPDSFVRSVS